MVTVALFLSAALVLVLAVAGLGWALRGKRIDDHPLCRVCGFDLTGKPEGSTRCSECGGDVTGAGAVVIGHRVVRWGWVWGVAPVVALALVVVVGMGTLMVSRADPNRYKPAWWLGYEALSNDTWGSWSAFEELERRATGGEDLRGVLGGVVDRLLDVQADTSSRWDASAGDLIIAIYGGKHEDDPRWQRFRSQSAASKIRVRPTIERGDVLPVELEWEARAGSDWFASFKREVTY